MRKVPLTDRLQARQEVEVHAKSGRNPRNPSNLVVFDLVMASELVKKSFPDGFEISKKVLKKGVF
jgi:hypothetical protein